MAGAMMALAAVGGTTGGTGTTLSALAWTAISGTDFGASNSQTIAGITTGVSISASRSGGGTLYYALNGALTAYTGAFTVHAGDTLAWAISTLYGAGTKTGTITVNNATTSTVVASIAFRVVDSGAGL